LFKQAQKYIFLQQGRRKNFYGQIIPTKRFPNNVPPAQ